MDQKPEEYVKFGMILIYPNEPFEDVLVEPDSEIEIYLSSDSETPYSYYLNLDIKKEFITAISAQLHGNKEYKVGFTHMELEAICCDQDDVPKRFFRIGKWIFQNEKVLLTVDDLITNFKMTGELLDKIADRLLEGEEYSPIEPYGEAVDRLIDMQPSALEDFYGEELEFDEIWELMKVKEIDNPKSLQ